MTTEAQRRATATWRERNNLRRVELLVPAETLEVIDREISGSNKSRSKYILGAIERQLGTAIQRDDTAAVLARIEAKVDELAAGSSPVYLPEQTQESEPGQTSGEGDNPVNTPDYMPEQEATEPTANQDPMELILAKSGEGWTHAQISAWLNEEGLKTKRGKAFSKSNVQVSLHRHRHGNANRSESTER